MRRKFYNGIDPYLNFYYGSCTINRLQYFLRFFYPFIFISSWIFYVVKLYFYYIIDQNNWCGVWVLCCINFTCSKESRINIITFKPSDQLLDVIEFLHGYYKGLIRCLIGLFWMMIFWLNYLVDIRNYTLLEAMVYSTCVIKIFFPDDFLRDRQVGIFVCIHIVIWIMRGGRWVLKICWQ